MKKCKSLITLILLTAACSCAAFSQGGTATSDITADEMRAHIKFLASDSLGGRGSGEPGNTVAATYVAGEFASYGLKPGGDGGSFEQSFTFISRTLPGENNILSMDVQGNKLSYVLEEEFLPLPFSTDTAITAPVVFVGFGITDTAAKYDDYAGVDVTGKIVAFFRYSPDSKNPHSEFAKKEPLRIKAFNAREHGAVGMIVIDDKLATNLGKRGELPFDRGFGSAGIPCIAMTKMAFAPVLSPYGKNVDTLNLLIDSLKTPSSLELEGTTVSFQTHVVKVTSTTANVIGYLEGNDPKLKDEYLVIGAHFDHLGMGGPGSGSLAPDTVAVHHGADDNASGTAGLLELAQYYAARPAKNARSMIFIGFSGEELGTLGSTYYVQHPFVPLEKTVAMLNLDMVGKLRDSTLVVEGIGTAKEFEEIAKSANADSALNLKLKQDGFGPSDHSSFYAKAVPVIFFFTNVHADYHKPSDTWEKINYEGEEQVIEYATRIVDHLHALPARPAYQKAEPTPVASTGGRMRVTLGIVPDYAEETNGVKISGARAGSPAEKAGLQGGDIILKFAGKEVKNLYDLTYLLGESRPGDIVELLVKRGTEQITLKAELEERK